jgi:hypothetical protein
MMLSLLMPVVLIGLLLFAEVVEFAVIINTRYRALREIRQMAEMLPEDRREEFLRQALAKEDEEPS